MKQRPFVIGLALWLATGVAASGQVYTWTDDQGTVHYTEDRATVPVKLRHKVRTLEEGTPAPEATATDPETAAAPPPAVAAQTPTEKLSEPVAVAPLELPAFTTQDQWQAELQRREAALAGVRQKLDEIAAVLKTMPRLTNEKAQLEKSHRTLWSQYNDMRAQYFAVVEAARKAGFPVNLEP